MAKHPSRFNFLSQSAFLQRLTVGVGLMVALGLLFYILEDWGLLLIALMLAVPLSREWVTICRITIKSRATFVLSITLMVATLLAYWQVTYLAMGMLFLITSVVIFLGWLTWRRGFLWLGGGVLYLGLPLISLMWMATSLVDPWSVLLWTILVLIANDTGGYFVGKAVGGPRLAPAISPLKTWSGFAGGLTASIGAGALAHVVFPLGMTALENAGLSLLLALGGTAGDLIESYIKRIHKIKDSGTLLPGHGGVLDRLDAYLIGIPLVALLIDWFPSLFYVIE